MTLAAWLAHILGVPSGEQAGFLLSVLLAFALGWLAKVWRDKLRTARYKRALFRGERLVRR